MVDIDKAPDQGHIGTVFRLFGERFGGAPDGVWSAPGRVNLIGEHTDYNEGFVLPFAIDKRTHVAARPRPDRILRIASTIRDEAVDVSLDELRPGLTDDWTGYVWGMAWALGAHHAPALPGLDILVDSHVPLGSGLSSSAALEAAAGIAMDDLWDLSTPRIDMARAGRRAENEIVGAPTGLMDQAAALLATTRHALFLDCRSEEATTVPLAIADAGLAVLVINTRVEHSHATGAYGERRASCEAAAATLGVSSLRDLGMEDLDRARRDLEPVTFRRVRHVVTENARVQTCVDALHTAGPLAIGDLLVASHVSLRDDYEVSCPELDVAVDTALEAGAIGARMTGGGFGGCAIALVPHGREAEVSQAVIEQFAAAGFTAPDTFTVAPSAGAHRDVLTTSDGTA